MDFQLSDRQDDLRAGLRELLTGECPPSAVRRQWDPSAGPVTQTRLWKQLSGLGLLGVLAPQSHGGLGGDEVDLAVLMEECGRFAVPGPLIGHVAVGVPVVAAARPELAAAAADGSLVITAAPTADRRFPEADVAGLFVGVAPGAVVLAGASGVRLGRRLKTVDRSARTWEVTITDAEAVPGADPVAAADRGALAVSAQLLGLAERILEMAVQYAKVRTQFGVPIGSQQAVKHHLATALIAIEHARPVVYRAAYALAHREPTASRDVSFAKVYAHRAAHVTARSSLQCHGAIAYTWEHDLHLWMKRAWSLAPEWGLVREHEDRLAAAIIDAQPDAERRDGQAGRGPGGGQGH